MGRGGAMLTPNEFVLTFGGHYFCANFGENRSSIKKRDRGEEGVSPISADLAPNIGCHGNVPLAIAKRI